MASLANLAQAAQSLLAAFVDQLEAQGVSVPDRRYRTHGPVPVFDGEQLTVGLVMIDQGQPGQPLAQTMHPSARHHSAQLSVNLVRRVATVEDGSIHGAAIPTAQEMDSDGATLLADATALIAAADQIQALDFNSNGQRYGLISPGESWVVGPLQPLIPQGGLAGHRLLVSVSVD